MGKIKMSGIPSLITEGQVYVNDKDKAELFNR